MGTWGRELDRVLHSSEGASWDREGVQLCGAWKAGPGPVRRHTDSQGCPVVVDWAGGYPERSGCLLIEMGGRGGSHQAESWNSASYGPSYKLTGPWQWHPSYWRRDGSSLKG